MKAEIPQESVLAPRLLKLITSEISETDEIKLFLYANDTAVAMTPVSKNMVTTRLQIVMNNNHDWCKMENSHQFREKQRRTHNNSKLSRADDKLK